MSEARTVSVIKTLKDIGINAESYKRGPSGKEPFIIAVESNKKGGHLKIWEGESNIEVITDKKHRQAILNVKERPRSITRKTRVTWYNNEEPTMEQMEHELREYFPVNVVGGSFKFKNVKVKKDTTYNTETQKEQPRDNFYYATISGEVTWKTNSRRTMSFLVGFDERHHFVSMLPETASSVEEAHAILRPKGLSKEAKRQGEWFFDPVSQKKARELTNFIVANSSKVRARDLEVNSSHRALQLVEIDKTKYVTGLVRDSREYRHEGLFLDGWHRVVRNLERVFRASGANRRSETWD